MIAFYPKSSITGSLKASAFLAIQKSCANLFGAAITGFPGTVLRVDVQSKGMRGSPCSRVKGLGGLKDYSFSAEMTSPLKGFLQWEGFVHGDWGLKGSGLAVRVNRNVLQRKFKLGFSLRSHLSTH